MATIYPIDYTGVSATNLVVNEVRTLSIGLDPIYKNIVPAYAPYFLDNFVLGHVDSGGTSTTLIEGQDYIHVFQYLAATRSVGKVVYGGVHITNPAIEGTFTMSYQTIGGNWVGDRAAIVENIASNNYNPRQVSWDQVTDVQDIFPPEIHVQPITDVTRYSDLISAINTISTAIGQNVDINPLIAHIADVDNPHIVTKEQVGLPDVINLPLATDEEVLNSEEVDKYISLRQMVQFTQREYDIVVPPEAVVRNRHYSFDVRLLHTPDNYPIHWGIEHVTTNDLDFGDTSGLITVMNGGGRLTLFTKGPNRTIENIFRIVLRTNGPTGTIVHRTRDMVLLDEVRGFAPIDLRTLDHLSPDTCVLNLIHGYGVYLDCLKTEIGYITSNNLDLAITAPSEPTIIAADVDNLHPCLEYLLGYGYTCEDEGITSIFMLDTIPPDLTAIDPEFYLTDYIIMGPLYNLAVSDGIATTNGNYRQMTNVPINQ